MQADGRTRRGFLITLSGGATAASMLAGQVAPAASERRIAPAGPGAVYKPRVKAAFVRRKGEYGMLWPGAVYDGAAALAKYRASTQAAAKKMGIELDLRPEPIFSAAETDEWVAAARAEQPDGLFVVMLDRQQHAWPTGAKAADTGIPTVIYSPVGTAFTTNTAPLDRKSVV